MWRLFYYVNTGYGFWLRVCGLGICVIDRSKIQEPFSVRNGYKKVIRYKKWTIHMLYPKGFLYA